MDLPPSADPLNIGALVWAWRQQTPGRAGGTDPEPGVGIAWGVAQALPYGLQAFDAVLLVWMLAHLPHLTLAKRGGRYVQGASSC